MNIKECIFKVSCAPKKKEAKQMPKVSTKNKVIYTSGTVKTQIKFVPFCYFWAD